MAVGWVRENRPYSEREQPGIGNNRDRLPGLGFVALETVLSCIGAEERLPRNSVKPPACRVPGMVASVGCDRHVHVKKLSCSVSPGAKSSPSCWVSGCATCQPAAGDTVG